MSARQARRRQNYGRRQHDLRSRRTRNDVASWLLDDPGSAGGGELGADRLRRPDVDVEPPVDAA